MTLFFPIVSKDLILIGKVESLKACTGSGWGEHCHLPEISEAFGAKGCFQLSVIREAQNESWAAGKATHLRKQHFSTWIIYRILWSFLAFPGSHSEIIPPKNKTYHLLNLQVFQQGPPSDDTSSPQKVFANCRLVWWFEFPGFLLWKGVFGFLNFKPPVPKITVKQLQGFTRWIRSPQCFLWNLSIEKSEAWPQWSASWKWSHSVVDWLGWLFIFFWGFRDGCFPKLERWALISPLKQHIYTIYTMTNARLHCRWYWTVSWRSKS